MPQSTTLSVPRRSVRARSIAGILAIALGMVCSVACDSWSPLQRSSSDPATAISTWQALLTLIEECERTAGRDVQRLEDCIPGPSPDLTPLVLTLLDSRRLFSSNGESASPGIDVFLEEVASEAEDPVLRAAARYYVAAGLMHSANALQVEPEDRDARLPDALDAARQGALASATGLSSGVEKEEFRSYLTGGPRVPLFPTFAEAEADLIRSIRHGTVGRWSDTGRLLHVQGYPTYVLVDEDGRILARPRFGLASLVRKAVARLSPPA